MQEPIKPAKGNTVPFDVFASFKRIKNGNPIIACQPPL